ncbi:MAG: cobalt-precorrin 5A hydrolase [Candidatus Limiplasma sp.]|nr:cobalt-precorrin 5A hydrolase [Candidatus Limiplasma sp.]
MIIRVVAYTGKGAATAARISAALRAQGHACRCYAPPQVCPQDAEPLTQAVGQWAEVGFREADALLFCCATGIAVRAIAPWVRSKTEDPAVLVVDEQGQFVIALLSGHLGGANELAQTVAAHIGATPVITTATDLNGIFSVDMFAQRNHLWIEDMSLAKAVSAALLAGKRVGFQTDVPCAGAWPEGLTENESELGVCVTSEPGEAPFARTLRLLPMRYAAGLGCRRGKSMEEMERFLLKQLSDSGATIRELRCVASIDLKQNEPGLVLLCKKYKIPFLTYSAKQLSAVPGVFTGSEFVRDKTGVDSVCERAAVLASGGKLVRHKTASDGMTFALAEYEEAIRFA